jgi:hypothetical protein
VANMIPICLFWVCIGYRINYAFPFFDSDVLKHSYNLSGNAFWLWCPECRCCFSYIYILYLYLYILYNSLFFLKTRYPDQGPTNLRGPITPPTCGGPFKARVFYSSVWTSPLKLTPGRTWDLRGAHYKVASQHH